MHNPIVTYKVSTLVANKLKSNPKDANKLPAIVTARQPYLLVSPLAMGPENSNYKVEKP